MKTAAVVVAALLALLGTTSAQDYADLAKDQRFIASKINSTINEIASKLKEYDPFSVGHKEITVFGHSFVIEALRVEGFSNFHASHINASGLLNVVAEITLEGPGIDVTVAKWKVEGSSFTGEGGLVAEVKGLRLEVALHYNLLNGEIDVKLKPSVDEVKIEITGTVNRRELSKSDNQKLNKILNEVLQRPKLIH